MGSSMDLSDKCIYPSLNICRCRKLLNGEGVLDELLAIANSVIITVGAAVLAFTAAKMITDEKLLDPIFDGTARINEIARWATYIIAIAIVLITSRIASRKTSTKSDTQSSTTLKSSTTKS